MCGGTGRRGASIEGTRRWTRTLPKVAHADRTPAPPRERAAPRARFQQACASGGGWWQQSTAETRAAPRMRWQQTEKPAAQRSLISLTEPRAHEPPSILPPRATGAGRMLWVHARFLTHPRTKDSTGTLQYSVLLGAHHVHDRGAYLCCEFRSGGGRTRLWHTAALLFF